MHWKSCASRSALPSSSTGWKKNKSMQCWRFHDGFFISGFPVLDGVSIWVIIPVNEPCPFQQLPRGWARPEARTSIRPPGRATWVP
jgi:hypothetical protein